MLEWRGGLLLLPWPRPPGPALRPRPSPGNPLLLEDELECLESQGRGKLGAVEEVPTMHHQIHLPFAGSFQRLPVVGQEVVAPAAALHPGVRGEIEAQMGIGHEEEAEGLPGNLGHRVPQTIPIPADLLPPGPGRSLLTRPEGRKRPNPPHAPRESGGRAHRIRRRSGVGARPQWPPAP